MRKVTLTKTQFDEYMFPAFAGGGAENESELETAFRLIRKFKDDKVTAEEVMSEEKTRAIENRGGKAIPTRELIGQEHTFLLEEDEWKLLKKRWSAHFKNFTLAVADETHELNDLLKNAEEYTEDADETDES